MLMKRNLILIPSMASLLILASCSSMGALDKSNFTVTPNPLETQGGKVTASIAGTFPEKYMKKKAVVTVTPELRYGNGQVAKGQSATFQGEKVAGNDQVIQYKTGGTYTMRSQFNYVPDMQKSDMYLTFNARKGNKTINIPDVKVADGVIATSELYKRTLMNAGACVAPDSFQRVQAQKQEANIRFLINQANLRKKELKNNSVKEFLSMLKKIKADQKGLNLKNVEVNAYASPDGGFAFNDKLADKRQNTTEKYVNQQLKGNKIKTDVDAHYTAQDWDGFQQLVQASNIQDKDVILRVLSMYKDPAERERQIRNMSQGFRELADGILPELRRSRLTINYETVGRSDDEIKQQYKADPSKLSKEELLYAATLTDNKAEKEDIYKTAAKLYNNDSRALNNLGALAFNSGNDQAARQYFTQGASAAQAAPEDNANLALLALKQGNVSEAENYVAKANGANDLNEVLGNLNLAKGNYAAAEKYFGNNATNSAALAQLLNKNYAGALSTLKSVKNADAMTDYLTALVNARQGNTEAASTALAKALSKDSSLKSYADNDLELSKLK